MAGEVVSDIVISGAKLYYAPLGTTLPLDTLAAGVVWPAPWVYIGYTLEPLTAGYSFEVLEVMVQQAMTAVKRKRISEEFTLGTTLAQLAAPNLALAYGGVASAVAPGIGQPGKEIFTIGGNTNLPTWMWGFEGKYEDEDLMVFPIRGWLWIATPAEGSETALDRENPTGIPLNLKGLADTSKAVDQQLFKWDRILEPATG